MVIQRKFPFPYRSMVSIDSDTDGTLMSRATGQREGFETYHRKFAALGLDVGDSFWFWGQTGFGLSYFNHVNTTSPSGWTQTPDRKSVV